MIMPWLTGLAIVVLVVAAVVLLTPYLLPLPDAPEIPEPEDLKDEDNGWPAIVSVIHQLHPPLDEAAHEVAAERLRATTAAVQKAGLMAEYDSAVRLQQPSEEPLVRDAIEAQRAFNRTILPKAPRLRIALDDDSQAEAAVADHAARIEAFDQALARPWLRALPPSPDANDPQSRNMMAYHMGSTDLVQLKLARGRLRYRSGDWSGGLRDVVETFSFGLRATAGARDATSAGMLASRFGMATVLSLLGKPPEQSLAETDPCDGWPTEGWSEEEQAAWRGALAELCELDVLAAFRASQAVEFRNRLTSVRSMGRAGRLRTWLHDPVYDERILRRLYAATIALAALPEARRDLPAAEAIAVRQGWRRRYSPCASYLLRMFAQGIHTQLSFRDHACQDIGVTVGAAAIKLYLEGHGRLPRDWSEVVADGLLEAPPEDPYTGEPLGYEPQRGLLLVAGTSVSEVLRHDDLNYGYLNRKMAEAFGDEADRAGARMVVYYNLPFVTAAVPTPWWSRSRAEILADGERVTEEYHRRMGWRGEGQDAGKQSV